MPFSLIKVFSMYGSHSFDLVCLRSVKCRNAYILYLVLVVTLNFVKPLHLINVSFYDIEYLHAMRAKIALYKLRRMTSIQLGAFVFERTYMHRWIRIHHFGYDYIIICIWWATFIDLFFYNWKKTWIDRFNCTIWG